MITAINEFLPLLDELNDGKVIKIYEKYPCLITDETDVSVWWDRLKFHDKVDVGNVLLHYGKMTPNCTFNCQDTAKFVDLSNLQKKRVKFAFSKKDDNYYYMFDIGSMFKL